MMKNKYPHKDLQKDAEANAMVADSMDVRLRLMERVHAGEISLEQAQLELKKIKKEANSKGMYKRDDFYEENLVDVSETRKKAIVKDYEELQKILPGKQGQAKKTKI